VQERLRLIDVLQCFDSSGRAVSVRASCAGGLELKSPATSILFSFANGSSPLQIYASSCIALALCCGDGHRKLVTRFGVMRRV